MKLIFNGIRATQESALAAESAAATAALAGSAAEAMLADGDRIIGENLFS